MTRMREIRNRGATNDESVAAGLEKTGGVITGAAAIMIIVFSAFMLSPLIMIKELGFALAVAVLIDATIVRIVLVPATMKLLGEWNWWLPRAIDRFVPSVEPESWTENGSNAGEHYGTRRTTN